MSCKRGVFLACIQAEFVIIWRKLNRDFNRKRNACAFSAKINRSVQSLFNFAYHTKLTRYKYTRNKIGRKTEIKSGKQQLGADILVRATLY